MAAADYRLLTEATGVRIAEALEDVTAMVGPKGDPGDVSEAELTAKLADKADVIVDTASGAIASFPDGAAVPAKDITIGIEPVQAGSGDPSPTNVRPISGWTGANVSRTGKNLLNKNSVKNGYLISYDTGKELYIGSNVCCTEYIPVAVGESYTFSGCGFYNNNAGAFYDKNKHWIGSFRQTYTVTAPVGAKYIRLSILTANLNISQLEAGTVATSYEPFGTTLPISWQSEAGTVYGGMLDVTTGVLTVTMAEVDLGTLNWSYVSVAGNLRFWSPFTSKSVSTETVANAKCSIYQTDSYSNVFYNVKDKTIALELGNYVVVYDSSYTDAATFKAAMSGVQLVYELATPQTYQLTPVEVEMLLGDNNVWADTGDSTVAYRADTKLYIQKINAPTDDDMIADAQIASGKYFIIGGNLYKSTTTIPAGDAINPGSNCILTNLADALNALNT